MSWVIEFMAANEELMRSLKPIFAQSRATELIGSICPKVVS